MKNYAGKIAVITGAGGGIGSALAIQLAKRGCVLVLADHNPDGLKDTRAQVEALGATCSVHQVDVADRSAVESFAAEVGRKHGAVHMLFNNAGVTLINRIEQTEYEDFEWLMNINFWGVVYGTKAFLPLMEEANEAHIVNVSSLFGLCSMPLQGAYNSSKFAVRGFTEALKLELAGTHINVSCVHPGGVKTGITRNSRLGDGVLDLSKDELSKAFDVAAKTTPEKAANTILRGMAKGRRRILIGLDAHLMDWIVRLFPGSYEKVLRLERGVVERRRARASNSFRHSASQSTIFP